MKKSILFLINGLGIEKAGSYSISIDQCMPNLAKIKETSYFTSAIINSLEYRSAYEAFFLGDTYKRELQYIHDNILNDTVKNNATFQSLKNHLDNPDTRLHVFVEPTNNKVVEEVNSLVKSLELDDKREVYLHLLLTQQTVNEYQNLIDVVNYIKYHLSSCITVGFILGKEVFPLELTKDDYDMAKRLFFYCSVERWIDTGQKLMDLKNSNVRPCEAPGFCAVNSCALKNGDAILFFNTKRTNYDNLIKSIVDQEKEIYKTDNVNLPFYSLIHLDTKYEIPFFAESVFYENNLASLLAKANKKALIITSDKNIQLVNFLANGLNYINNPNIQFMKLDNPYLNSLENIQALIDQSPYELIIFDYHMDVSKTINDLKAQLSQIDVVLGMVANVCVNKHSLFITSLYGIKKMLPLAQYNGEMVTIDYEMQIPIFFFDYSYPRSKYGLRPGETNDILHTALRCIWDTNSIDSLIYTKGILNNIFGKK